jgi:ABC-2 type transport system permease protein
VIRPFFFVLTRSAKNRIVGRLRRLRNPRYLLSAIAGIAYFWLMFFRRSMRSGRPLAMPFAFAANDVALGAFSILILVMAIAAWALPSDSGGLEFSPAEIQFLFPAPVSRRQLLLYKIIRGQARLLISVVIFTILGLRQGAVIGLWAAMTVFNIYLIMARLGRARLRLAGFGLIKRIVAVSVLLTGFCEVLRRQAPIGALAHLAEGGQIRTETVLDIARTTLHQPPLSWLLFLPRFFAMAILPIDRMALATGVSALAVFAVALFLIASKLNVSFEEASIVISQERDDRKARRRGMRMGQSVAFRKIPPPFRLKPGGPPELAIIWKNAIAFLRTTSAWILIIVAVLVTQLWTAVFASYRNVFTTIGVMTLIYAALFAVIGGMIVRNDFRLDLRQMEILKSLPISAERMVAAEILSPLAIIAVIETAMLFMAVVALRLSNPTGQLASCSTPEFFVAAVLVVVPLCAIQLIIQNAAVLLLPAWSVPSKDEVRGFVATGQRVLMLIGHLVCLTVALIPAAIVAAGSFFIAHRFVTDLEAAIAIAVLPGVAVMVAEAFAGMKALGMQFESIDVSVDLENVVSE